MEQVRLERFRESSNYVPIDKEGSRKDQRRLSENEQLVQQAREQSYRDSYLRRQNSEGDTNVKVDSAKAPTVKEKKTEPDVPVRSARKNRVPRETLCRSMGESADTVTETRTLFLKTINEADLKSTNLLTRKESGDGLRVVSDWFVNKDPQVNV